ncbi:DegT/DnrJ/EryC1/StrS family aminotransferase [Thermodesulfobacteriota bacterium]
MPERNTLIPITRPRMDEREVRAAERAILSGWVTQGPEVMAFEKEFASYVGAKYACAVSSCTAALHLALLTIGIMPGDEVITVSHSFIATANSIRYCGAVPVFVDIEPDTYNIDPELIEKAVTNRTRAILCVHQMGMPCNVEAVVEIAGRYGLPVVEDAACAIGSQILWKDKWEHVGKPHGDIACFSFHPRKVITTGDGGMITTVNREWDERIRLLRQHGMSVPDLKRHKGKKVVFEAYEMLGYNYRMTDIQAAIGREQMKKLPAIVESRRLLAERYHEALAGIDGIGLPREPSRARSNWQSYCIRLPEGRRQDQVMQFLLDRNIATKRGILCAHREPIYAGRAWSCCSKTEGNGLLGDCECLSKSESASDQTILLPLFPQMTEKEQEKVVATLYDACTD